MNTHVKNNQAGFTLIEYIVALVVAAIVASMVYTFFGSALTQSSVPIERLQQVSNLQQVMENIVSDYRKLNQINLRYKWRSNHNYQIGAVVLPSTHANNNIDSKISNKGRYYVCTKAGTSGTGMSPESWPVTPGLTGTVTGDGTVEWKEAGYTWKENMSYPANAIVVPALNNGHFYRGPASPNPFTSGPTEPSWPKTANASVSDGTVTWTEVGTILSAVDSGIVHLYDKATSYGAYLGQTGRYGTGYTVVASETKFVQFDSTNTMRDAGSSGTSSEENILKLTIKNNNSAETLTQFFTIQ